MQFFTVLQLGFHELIEIILCRTLKGVVLRFKGLQDGSAAQCAPAGTAGHLGDELEGAFGGPKIRQVQSEVCQDDAHQGHQRQVKPLGKHLSANENIGTVLSEMVEDQVMRAFVARGIGVPAQGAGGRELFKDEFFKALGAHTELAHIDASAGGAGFRHLALMVTVMAEEQHTVGMPGVLGVAAAAAQNESAVPAKHVGGAAAAI